MTIQDINKTYSRIIEWLDRKELKNVFDGLQGLIAGSGHYNFQDKLDELQETYKYMLRYRMDGIQDPMQEQIYRQIQASAYELADAVKLKALATDSPLYYYSRRRSLKLSCAIPFRNLHQQLGSVQDMKAADADVCVKQELEAACLTLFNKIWISDPLSTEEVCELQAVLQDEELPESVGCQVVSALLLGLEEYFDKEKMGLLFDAASSRKQEISVRALIAILLVLYKYRKRISLYPFVSDRMSALAEALPSFTQIIQTIILRFILSRETEKISKKLWDEILPGMMKLSPTLGEKINLKDLNPEQLGDEMNPEWQESIFADKELSRMMTEFSELQMEGADVLHSTFVHLKNYPFFREIGNWFLPFDAGHSVLTSGFKGNQNELHLFEQVTQTSFMCNSDQYSFFLSMLQLPESARTAMMGQFDGQTAEMIRQNREELLEKHSKVEQIAGRYIQDLYRFYKLFPSHLDFDDIFTYTLDFHNLSEVRPFISDAVSLTAIAEYYLRKNYFQDALTIFEELIKQDSENDILYQKAGYCRQMNGDLEGALKDYLHADLLNPNSKWIIRRIAVCYKTLKQPEKALAYYHRYEALNPDNLSVQISIGHCHLELKNYNEALKYYYKVDYLDTSSHKAWRPIAWCSFLTGKYDQARKYYKKILEAQPNTQDFLNAGHTEWVLQNNKAALAYYKQAVEKEGGDWFKFYKQFEQDIADLKNAGIEEEEIPLMLDQLRYML